MSMDRRAFLAGAGAVAAVAATGVPAAVPEAPVSPYEPGFWLRLSMGGKGPDCLLPVTKFEGMYDAQIPFTGSFSLTLETPVGLSIPIDHGRVFHLAAGDTARINFQRSDA